MNWKQNILIIFLLLYLFQDSSGLNGYYNQRRLGGSSVASQKINLEENKWMEYAADVNLDGLDEKHASITRDYRTGKCVIQSLITGQISIRKLDPLNIDRPPPA